MGSPHHGAGRPIGGNSEILTITPDGDDAVIVSYSDMWHKASTRREFVKDGENYKVNSARVTYGAETRIIEWYIRQYQIVMSDANKKRNDNQYERK